MTLEQLQKHAQAAKEANDLGISAMWGNEVLVKPYVFLDILQTHNLARSVSQIDNNQVQVKTSINGLNYFTVVRKDIYTKMFEKTA
ncbi:hypothetical protein SAMN05421676_11247 [Salinibacillus kushneri]|uniref:Uncharacterized protein n=1 Tax=Salinibacillus kushneri TaxID=237682 RepID=A0A1I0IH85_9BACI|nr:hypothetical protein [Salinibacillus kushneri]SET95466.1 hypothetical protein SAMN05421676_11247 [Salinibacillus kushneri]